MDDTTRYLYDNIDPEEMPGATAMLDLVGIRLTGDKPAFDARLAEYRRTLSSADFDHLLEWTFAFGLAHMVLAAALSGNSPVTYFEQVQSGFAQFATGLTAHREAQG